MKTIEELLKNLARPEVLEFALASDRLPCVKIGGSFQPVDGAAPATDAILQMLVGVGGSRYVESLGPKPTQWTTRLDGVGIVTISAIMRNEVVQARFTLTKREVPQAQERPDPTAVGKDTLVIAPPKKDISVTKRDPRREQTDPPAPPKSDVDDEPTLMSQALSPGPARPRPEMPLDIELDDKARPAPAPAAVPLRGPQASPPRPPPPAPLDDDDTTAEIDVPSAPLQASPVVVLQDPVPEKAHARVSTGTQPLSPPAVSGKSHDPRKLAVAAADAKAKGKANLPASEPEEDPGSVAATVRIQLAPDREPSIGMELDELMGLARTAGASDLHVAAGRPALLRIGGELAARTMPIDAAIVDKLALDIVPSRVAGELEAAGACDFSLEHPAHGRFRVNVSRQRTGLKVCMRLVPRVIPTLSALGLPDAIAQALRHHQGLILVTGPSGHGKTNTLAALVDIINRESSYHVITVEDPIEFVHPRKRALLSQREVGTHTRSFGAALKGALREDPDVMVIGELRDAETVRMALSASETGHLVLGTMSTPSAAKTIDRLIDLFPPAEQQQVRMTLAGALRLVVSQRLVPNADKSRLFAAAEILPGSVSLYALIRDDKTFQIPSLQQRGRAHGIVRLDDSLADLVRAGSATLASARAFADDPEDFEALVGQRPPAAASPPGQGQPNQAAALGKKRVPEEQPVDLGGILSKAGSLFGGKKG